MKNITHYLQCKCFMMQHMAFATENDSLRDSLYHLIFYHWYKDFAQEKYFRMSHAEREQLHDLMIL